MDSSNTFWTVLEVQVDQAYNKSCIPTIYVTEDQAYAKYYTILAAAAVSYIPYHAAHIIRSDGVMIEGKVFDRMVIEPVVVGE